jgi:DNA-binding NtrC family response regulator
VGKSPGIRQVLNLILKLGRSSSPVLVLGETGTGKEVVARAIHKVHACGPFVPVDCAALVGPLMESELFGHVKGAFTGAIANKPGLVEFARGGTAFFDEIGELPLEMQSKLLRVLQEKEYRPVGSVEWRKADFRVIAATNRDLAQEVDRGRFRSDLYYRLNVVTIRIPPLRERKEDIPLLVNYFLRRTGANHSLTPECLDAMASYDWPGNVRELENCIQRMVALNSGPLLHTADLPSSVQNHLAAARHNQLIMAAGASHSGNYTRESSPRISQTGPPLPLNELERRAILQALEYTKGDRVMAAQLLGIGRTTLYRKLKEYGLNS